jgi:hypothetical protein
MAKRDTGGMWKKIEVQEGEAMKMAAEETIKRVGEVIHVNEKKRTLEGSQPACCLSGSLSKQFSRCCYPSSSIKLLLCFYLALIITSS